jgi:hypothetical protein
MAHQLSGHLWNAALLVVSASVALAADRIGGGTASSRVVATGSLDAAALGDVGDFMMPIGADVVLPRYRMNVRIDPFGRLTAVEQADVASQGSARTVASSPAQGRGLTAILIADQRRVAVIDDAAVGVGDVLRDGARVAAIQPDRVFVVGKNGRWRTLTLTNGGNR